MKKLSILFLGIILSFTLVACSSNNSSSTESKPTEYTKLSKADQKNIKFDFDLLRDKSMDPDPRTPLDYGGPHMKINVTIHNNSSKDVLFYNKYWIIGDMEDYNQIAGYNTKDTGSQIVKSHSSKTIKNVISGSGNGDLGLLSADTHIRYHNISLRKGTFQSYLDLINKLNHDKPGDLNYKTMDNLD